MRRFIGHAVAGTMFLTISVWWFIGDVLQMNRRSGTVGSWFLHIGFILYGTKPRKNTPENVELSEFVFFFTWADFIYSLCIYVVALYIFVVLPKRTNWTNPFGELFGRWKGKRLRSRPDRMPDSDICHNMNKWSWGSFFSLSDEKRKWECKYWKFEEQNK